MPQDAENWESADVELKQSFTATRVDAAHRLADAALPGAGQPEFAPAAAVEPEHQRAVMLVQQVRSQASQLAAHLQHQQSGLDHREAELNARVAAIESQVRAARLWLAERQTALAEREAELKRRESEFSEREFETRWSRVGVPSGVSAGDEPSFSPAQDRHHAAEAAGRAAHDARSAATDETIRQLEEKLARYEERAQHLDKAESLLAAQHAQLEEEHRRLALDRQTAREQAEADRRRLAEEREAMLADLDQQKLAFRRRSDELDSRQAAIRQMQGEVARVQRETLEMRLATEELWARLCGTMAPAALTRSLGQIRLQLADQNRLAHQDLAQQKSDLQALAARLDEQHEKLARQRGEVQAWAERRQTEIEAQAAVLVSREQDLDRQEAQFKAQARAWSEERHGYQKEMRRMLRQLRQMEQAAA